MIIKKLEIHNFRSLKSVEINCEELIAILGRNGTGKSSILYALNKFYDVNAQFLEYDYYNCNQDLEIIIRVTFGNLRKMELEEFSVYIQNNEFVVTKRINKAGAKYYAVESRIQLFSEIRKISKAIDKRNKYKELLESNVLKDLPESHGSAMVVEQNMNEYENQHPELCERIEMETQLFGPARIGGGKLDKYTKFLLIPAIKDVNDETQKKGAITQLLDVLVERSVNNREDVKKFKSTFEEECRKIFNTDNLFELKDLSNLITENLNIFAPGAELSLTFGDVNIPEINLPEAVPHLAEDKFSAPPNFSGHGLQRSLIFALFRQLSLTNTNAIDIENEEESEEITDKDIRHVLPDLIIAIEEPELYLHPSKCRYLSNTLLQLSKKSKDENRPNTQIFYATHSPFFVDLDRFNHVNIAQKVDGINEEAKYCVVNSYSINQATSKLKEVTGDDNISFTSMSFHAHSYPVMTTIVNEGYFSDFIVIVEGLTDASALWTIQKLLNQKWDELNINIIPVSGKNNIDRPVIIFNGFKIKTYFIFDADSSLTKEALENTKKTNKILTRLGGIEPTEHTQTNITNKFTVFEDKLETEIKISIDETNYNEIRNNIALILGYDKPSKVLKNYEGMRLFIEDVYKKGLKIDILEKIVLKITELYNLKN